MARVLSREKNPSLCENQVAVQMYRSAHLFSRGFLEANSPKHVAAVCEKNPQVGAAFSKSVPTVANRLFKRGSFQVLSPGKRTSKHIQTLRWRSFPFFFPEGFRLSWQREKLKI